MTRTTSSPPPSDELRNRLRRLGLYGLLAHWETYANAPWLPDLTRVEEEERARRSLERRVRSAKLGRFKPLVDFDWCWPSTVDRQLVDEIFSLTFLEEAGNVVFMGPNGVGKTTLAKNLTYQALLQGCTACFTTASQMLNDLASQESPAALARRLRRYCRPSLLAIDEVGYLSYGNRHADLLFEVVSRRAEEKSTVVTTNRPFSEWSEVFPNATSVVALVDRLAQRADIVMIEGNSYRLKEARERQARRTKTRKKKRVSKPTAKKKAPAKRGRRR
jgi:DNA replication protein DnaC